MNFFKKLFVKPQTLELTVTSSSGFHLRPVAQFVNTAKSYKDEIKATFNGKTVSAKAVNALLSLNLDKGDTFTLTAKGESASQALEKLKYLFDSLMEQDIETVTINKKAQDYEASSIKGDIICEGIAIAPLYLYETKQSYTPKDCTFNEAISLSITELENLYETHKTQSNASIYLAQKELLLSLSAKKCQTLESFEQHITQECQILKGGKLEAKIADYQDLLRRVKIHLGYSYTFTPPHAPFILLADDLLPSDILTLEDSNAVAVILKHTSPTSHTAILLRASGLASLIVNSNIPDRQENIQKNVIVDATAGVLLLSPTSKDLKKAQKLQYLQTLDKSKASSKRHQQAWTRSEKRIYVLANVSDIESAKLAKDEGAEGIGLLRTEFLFTQTKPTLSKQVKAYESIFSLFTNITVRTLDVGGDKALPYLDIPPEDNPFLGLRGVRLFHTHYEILEEQLHAILLAANGKKIKIMFPMVSTVEEFTKAKSFTKEIAAKNQIDISNVRFGIMIEVPSVLFLMKDFNKIVDFYSIGTNDLTQYLFATERTHPLLKTDTLSPVVFSAIDNILKQTTKPVSICGELASNTKAIKKLLSLGLNTLSVTPKLIAQTKESIRNI